MHYDLWHAQHDREPVEVRKFAAARPRCSGRAAGHRIHGGPQMTQHVKSGFWMVLVPGACHYRTVDAEIIGEFRGAFRPFSSVGVRQCLA